MNVTIDSGPGSLHDGYMEAAIWDSKAMVDELDAIIFQQEDIDMAVARIPALFGTSDKATFLGFRSLGFNTQECLQILELPADTCKIWEQDSPGFLEFERRSLPLLQKLSGVQILRQGFLRNMTLFMFKDAQILRKAMTQFDHLTEDERKYLMAVRKHYTPSDLLAFEKVIAPDRHNEKVVINLSWGGNDRPELIEGTKAEYTFEDYEDEPSTDQEDRV